MLKDWKIIPPNPLKQSTLIKECGISNILAQVLINRGLSSSLEIEEFLNSRLHCLHQPFQLKDMPRAVERIKRASRKGEKVLIVGDYDVDGITAVALLELVLRELGIEVEHYLPHRINEGYGLSKGAIDFAKRLEASLVITVDCGISDFEEIAALNELGSDTIILDHHYPSPRGLPSAFAIIDPKREDCPYPYKELASVGLAYKLSQALTKGSSRRELDLVCLGTVADVLPLNGENRTLVRFGLEVLSSSNRPGIKALLEVSGLKDKEILPQFVSFILAPRINASGRLNSAEVSLKLLLTHSYSEAQKLAFDLDRFNKDRQRIQEEVFEEALAKVEREISFKENIVIVLEREGWHQGVLGIVASKLVEKFYRPAFLISWDRGLGKGSGRSIDGFHLFEALARCRHTLDDFGGHRYAAGLAIQKGLLDDFKREINQVAREWLKPRDLLPSLEIDMEIPLSRLNGDLLGEIDKLAPFGIGNHKPVFCSANLIIRGKPQVLGRDTLKFWVSDGKATYPALGFRMADYLDIVLTSERIDLAYSPSLDTWQGNTTIQLELKDLRPTSNQ